MAEVPELIDAPENYDEDLDDEDGWEECPADDDESRLPECHCLFCAAELATPEAIFMHCMQKHGFNIVEIHRQFLLDCFSYIKLINYVRTAKPDPRTLLDRLPNGRAVWDSDENMKPAMEDDGLLQFDIEDLSIETFDNPTCPDGKGCSPDRPMVSDVVTVPVSVYQDLIQRLQTAETKVKVTEGELEQAVVDLNKLRSTTRELILTQPTELPSGDKAIQSLQDGEDDAYMDSYGHFGIHLDMLQDKVRTESYRDAICNSPDLFADKVVLDVGCGTGILSMFAARAGARLVIGVDMSDVVYQAMDIVRENGLESRVKILKGRMEDVNLPVEKVDIIISEWMGYFLLFESMLDTVLWARDKYLTDGGLVLPDLCQVCLAAVDDAQLRQKNLSFWDDVYGFKMSCMKAAVLKEGSLTIVKPETVITDSCVIKEIDICTCATHDLEFSSPFRLGVQREGQVTAIIGYFDTHFKKCSNKVTFSTGPFGTPTHWKQTVFLLEDTITVKTGDVIEGQLLCQKHRKDPRSLQVTLTIGNQTSKYVLQ